MGAERIVLINPNRWKPHVAPVALEYICSALASRELSADVLDLCHSDSPTADIRAYFHQRPADLIGVTHRNLDDIHYGRVMWPEIRLAIDAIKDSTDAPIVLGGSGFSICPEYLLDYFGVDLGIAGEGEFALPMLARSLGDTEAYSGIPGLVHRSNGGFRRNPVGLESLDGTCLSSRCKLDYSAYVGEKGDEGGTGIQTKRGCPMDCIYCVVPAIEGRVMRLRPAADVVNEIENLLSKGVKRFFVADSEFNYPEEHAREVCEEIIRRKLGNSIRWYVYLSPKPFSLDLAKLMIEAGCKLAIFSVENGNEKILQYMRKDFTPDDIRTTGHACKEAGLIFSYCTMFGGPGETMDTVLETLNLFREIKPTGVTYWDPPGLRIYPNTPLADIVREEGFTKLNPNLHGCIEGNDDFLQPVFYLSAGMGLLATGIKAWRKLGLLRQRFLSSL